MTIINFPQIISDPVRTGAYTHCTVHVVHFFFHPALILAGDLRFDLCVLWRDPPRSFSHYRGAIQSQKH